MKLNYKDSDFSISTKGLEILKKIMYVNIGIIAFLSLVFCYVQTQNLRIGESAFPQIVVILLIGFAVAIPSIIICLLIKMIIDWTYNVEEQSKLQFNISNNTEDIKDILNKLLEIHQSEISQK